MSRIISHRPSHEPDQPYPDHGWAKSIVEWTDESTQLVYLSIVFSWHLPMAYQRAIWYRQLGYRVLAGGPAVVLQKGYLAEVADCKTVLDEGVALSRHNPRATFTSRGCIRKCRFCAVPRIEGDLVELADWPLRPTICDNNLLACSRRHFDRVIDRLKPVAGIDFNQGLDARLLTTHHAQRLAELDSKIRLAWDHIDDESAFRRAFALLRQVGLPKSRLSCYVLIGFHDTPADALYRLQAVTDLGINPFPMRYQPINARRKNEYVAPGWTHRELQRFVRYWSNKRYMGSVPFSEWQ